MPSARPIMFSFGVTRRPGPDLHDRMAGVRHGAADGRHLLGNRPARVAAVALIAVTTFKCFLYDLNSLEGLARVASFVGLAISLALVSVVLQKYVLKTRPAT